MYNGNYGGYGGMFRQPAQREIISGGYEGGVRIPVIQAFASIIFASITILFTWVLLFVIGPDVLWVAGFVTILVMARRILLWIGTAQQDTQEQINGARVATIVVCIIALTLAVAWAMSRQFCVIHWPMILPTVSIWRTVFAITFIIPPIIVCAFMAFQFLVNAYNPTAFQPHQAKPAGTPWWSPTGQYIIETDPDNPEQIFIDRDIPRPVPTFDINHPNPNNVHLQDRMIALSDSAHKIPAKSTTLPAGAFKAPNGRIARIEDLAEFLMDGVTIGATFQVWHKRKNWGEEYWQAMIGTCAQHGFAKPARIKSRSKLLIKTKREAALAIEHLRSYLFASPYPAPETINTEYYTTSDR